MPGTPTPNLNLAIPTVGSDVNTWGNELNANLSAIDTAIAADVINVSATTNLAFGPSVETFYRYTTGATSMLAVLPALTASSIGKRFRIKKLDSGVGTVTVTGTIDGGSNYVLVQQGQYVLLVYNGASWDFIGGN